MHDFIKQCERILVLRKKMKIDEFKEEHKAITIIFESNPRSSSITSVYTLKKEKVSLRRFLRCIQVKNFCFIRPLEMNVYVHQIVLNS